MIRKLFYLFIFFAPFTSFFAISAWLRLPVVINQLLFIILIIGTLKSNKVKTKWILKEDLFLLGFLVLIWVSFLFGFLEKRSFNHSLAYTNAVLFFFFLSKYTIEYLKITSIEIARIIYFSFLAMSFIMIVDFIGINYFNFSLRKLYSEVDGAISNMDYFIRAGLERVGGVAEEPGHMALFYNIYFGVSLYYIYSIKAVKKYKWLLMLFVFCHFAMMSNAGIVLPIFAGIIIFLINKLENLKISSKQLLIIICTAIILMLAVALILIFDFGNISAILEDFFDKVFFNEADKSYSSSGQRLKQWQRAFENFWKRPILGNGPGYGVNEDVEGYLSIYLTILSDIGILGFLFFLSFQDVIIRKTLKMNSVVRSFFLFSIITSFLHLIIIADFYHAPFWILLFMVQLVYKEQKEVCI